MSIIQKTTTEQTHLSEQAIKKDAMRYSFFLFSVVYYHAEREIDTDTQAICT